MRRPAKRRARSMSQRWKLCPTASGPPTWAETHPPRASPTRWCEGCVQRSTYGAHSPTSKNEKEPRGFPLLAGSASPTRLLSFRYIDGTYLRIGFSPRRLRGVGDKVMAGGTRAIPATQTYEGKPRGRPFRYIDGIYLKRASLLAMLGSG